jgi:beta-glucosidase
VDAVHNRIFLDPLLRGRYPDDLRADVAAVSDLGFVQDGDEATIGVPIDVLGVNYYARTVVRAGNEADGPDDGALAWVGSTGVRRVAQGLPTTAMGWEIDPTGLYDALTRVTREYGPVPLYVTENGAAFDDRVAPDGSVPDPDRAAYLDGHFREALRAVRDGVDLRGYFVWSLLDNFEWAYGYSKRFGIVHVDYETQVRTPKSSALWYADVIRRNGLPD